MSNSSQAGGMGCLTVIGIVLVVLKFLSVEPVAHWSWLWVLCPFWGPFALIVALFLIAGIFGRRN